MIYITGDCHREFKRIKYFCSKFQTTKNDYLIILGDVGINYYGQLDKPLKQELQDLPITFLCIQGNHEERPANIKTYQEINMFDGIVYQEKDYPNLIFLKDGEIYNLNNQKVLVIGGAFSVNKELLLKLGYKWFKDEQPSEEIKEKTLKNLEKHNYQVDIILSHTCPFKYLPLEKFYVDIDQNLVDNSLEHFLDKIEEITTYQSWYCGHFHTDKVVDKINFMFESYKSINSKGEI